MNGRTVCVVVPGGLDGPGGMCRMAAYHASEWTARGRTPDLQVLDSTGPGARFGTVLPFLRTVLRVASLGARGRIALLHLHMAERGSVLRKGALLLLGRLLGIPVVIHLHAAEFTEFCDRLPRPLRRLVAALLGRADLVLALGAAPRDLLTERLGLPRTRVAVLRNAVPVPPPMRAREAGGGPCRLLFLGRVGVRKGVADLLQALASPVLAAHSWHIDLAGDGDIEAYADRARALGLQDRVRFHGWTDPAPLLARADILVLPSRNEGLPVAIIEAMAHGLPVVATPVGAIEEAVRHEQTGLIVPPRNPGALAAALARLIADPALRHRLGAAGRERYLAEFEIGAFNDRLQAMLAQVIAARGGRFPEAA